MADDVRECIGAVAAIEGGGHGLSLTVGTDLRIGPGEGPLAAPVAAWPERERTPHAPVRARLPLLPSGPGGVHRIDAARGPPVSLIPEAEQLAAAILAAPPLGYHGPRRIRLVAYGARLERGLG